MPEAFPDESGRMGIEIQHHRLYGSFSGIDAEAVAKMRLDRKIFGSFEPRFSHRQFADPRQRTIRNILLLIVVGALLGATCLPAGLLLIDSGLFLTLIPWQVGLGLLLMEIEDRGRTIAGQE